MTKFAFITGVTGQDGSYLAEYLLNKNYRVFGFLRRSSTDNTENIRHLLDSLRIKHGDMTDISSIITALKSIKEEIGEKDVLEIYNLAAQSHVKVSFEIPVYTALSDALGTLHLLEGIRYLDMERRVRIYQASTSELYGRNQDTPQDENTLFDPCSPYSIAKQYAYNICHNYRNSYNMYICNGILFNHESPRRNPMFVTRKITRGVADIIKGKKNCLYLGNLNAKRDWGHAKDYIKAMYLMLQQEKPDDYVVATGQQHNVRQFVETCFDYFGKKITWHGEGVEEKGYVNGEVRVQIDPDFFRPEEVESLMGNCSKISKIGWQPEYSFQELVEEMLQVDLD